MICSGENLFRAINLPPYEVFRSETNITTGPVFGGQVTKATSNYLDIDIKDLKECALDQEVFLNHANA
jgi:hypothetical protein